MIPTLEIDDSRIFVRLEKVSPAVAGSLAAAVAALIGPLVSDAQALALAHIHTQGLNPGAYLESIHGGMSEKSGSVIGYLRSGSPLVHLLEDGAQTPAHDILPKSATVLAFEGDAGRVYARAVHSPGATIPAYPALAPAFEEHAAQIADALRDAVGDAVSET
ncbi:hypothetical protein CWB41_14000 [Methylovirgula ligni]|uniref:HK97 gp10 family phage protein n=1 Tax=Methylovirgula ligni TaxID=569860 RepID=A0A3D9YP34_9HYPH|nr:hypothetical protein [Methylovirgula ligni]QAY96706.1 hypothetical protein CWB41_14000 [Methylovirgula ligni]REF83253.1 hypothetical protein DES32_3169 [Methylovirgula ligni]